MLPDSNKTLLNTTFTAILSKFLASSEVTESFLNFFERKVQGILMPPNTLLFYSFHLGNKQSKNKPHLKTNRKHSNTKNITWTHNRNVNPDPHKWNQYGMSFCTYCIWSYILLLGFKKQFLMICIIYLAASRSDAFGANRSRNCWIVLPRKQGSRVSSISDTKAMNDWKTRRKSEGAQAGNKLDEHFIHLYFVQFPNENTDVTEKSSYMQFFQLFRKSSTRRQIR